MHIAAEARNALAQQYRCSLRTVVAEAGKEVARAVATAEMESEELWTRHEETTRLAVTANDEESKAHQAELTELSRFLLSFWRQILYFSFPCTACVITGRIAHALHAIQ